MEFSHQRNYSKYMTFKKVERSYYSTAEGWRLATFKEAIEGTNIIKDNNILNRWDRVRLLDGWITGEGYNFEMGNDFGGCLGYMLLIKSQTSGFAYADVDLSDSGKEVAFFLCVDDWNFEVVYWLLNCWSKSETMNLADVKGGNIPLSNATNFKEMNKSIGHVATRLGELAGNELEKKENMKYTGVDSIKDVLSGMLKGVTEEEEIVQCIDQGMRSYFTYFETEEYCLPESVNPEEVAEAFWSFVCDSFAGFVVELCANQSLEAIPNMKKKSTGGNNFMMANLILLDLSYYRTDIIHEPIFHRCHNLCSAKIISYAAGKAEGKPQVFSEMLQKNAMWRCYDGTANYGVLHKLLTIVAIAKYNEKFDKGDKVAGEVVEMLLQCGAQPQIPYRVMGNDEGKTTLQLVAMFRDEDVGEEVAKALLSRCDEQSIREFVNAADDQGRTALHVASQKGNARICKLLLDTGASLTAQDEDKMTALHYAVQWKEDKVTGVLLKSPLVSESLPLKDSRDSTPLDIALANKYYPSIARLLSKTKEPEAYLSKVNKEQLLRHSILVGSVNIVINLFDEGVKLPDNDCDDDGRTLFHLVAMCDDESSAMEIFTLGKMIFTKNVGKMVVIQDRKGRTALHEAALKGHEELCLGLLELNSELVYVKDRYGQNSLYDAVRGESNNTNLFKQLQEAYLEKDMPEDDLVNRSGLTLLHFAASEGKALHVKELLSSDIMKNSYLSRGDMVGQTALHKAAKRGYNDIVEILLKKGAHPLRERDCDGRTALHYAVQADIQDKTKLVETLLKPCTDEEKSLLLWASAAGLGTADEKLSTDDSLRQFLSGKKKEYGKNNLLRTAASLGQIQMTKELLSRGYPIEDIRDEEWIKNLSEAKKRNVKIVSRQIEKIKEQGNDKPAITDSLGRMDYAHGLAALFLNPYIKPPIAVGITGSWGTGKSSLMLQTERILLTSAAHMALFQSSKLSSSASNLPKIKLCELSKTGERKWKHIYNYIKYGANKNRFVILWDNLKSVLKRPNIENGANRNRFVILWDNFKSVLKRPGIGEVHEQLEDFLNNDEFKNIEVFKALAAMDSSKMLEENVSRTNEEDPSGKQNVPAVLTVQYNAWKYKDDTEALAGLAVEITRGLEGIVTPAQWLSTCWRYNWQKKKYTILFEIFIPCFFAIVLASSIAWIAWVVLGSEKFKEWGEAKYAWPPTAAVTVLWTLTKKVKGILKPISSQLMQYVSAPDHTDKLGYQERVIEDIKFLKDETGEKPHWLFIVFAWVYSIFSVLSRHRSVGKAMEALKIRPASSSHLRIIAFLDDLDRCDEFVILQVLSAVNLVLAVCEISVVLGMDKRLIERAILKKHGEQNTGISLIDNQKLAEMYLQKIIQLPLDLPDPSDEETRRFLRAQLGVSQQNEDKESMEEDTMLSSDKGEGEAGKKNPEVQVDIKDQPPSEITKMERREPTETGREVPSQTNGDASVQRKSGTLVVRKLSPYILRREILFVSYSEGEEKAFLYFQRLATECRKLPREWKRLINYHRLVWYIFSVTEEENQLYGWQVQLITWIFVCWEWEENMDFIIKRWKEIVNTPESKGFSLLMIVEQLMEELQREMNAEDGYEGTQKNNEGEGSVAEIHNDGETNSSSGEVNEETKSSSGEVNEETKTSSGEVNEETKTSRGEDEEVNEKKAISMKLDALVKSLAKLEEEMIELDNKIEKQLKDLQKQVSGEMEKQINELQKQVSGEMKKDINELHKQVSGEMEKQIKELQRQVSEEMKKDINELKRQMVTQQNGTKEENIEPEKLKLLKLENWKRMKSALERYDVPMDGIQAFQRFRFYCIAGYLPLPS